MRFLWVIRLILLFYLLGCYKREAGKGDCIEVFFVHIYGGYLVVVVGCIVVNAFVGVAAGRIDCYFVLALSKMATAALLVNRAENVEKLAHTLCLALSRKRGHFCKSNTNKA